MFGRDLLMYPKTVLVEFLVSHETHKKGDTTYMTREQAIVLVTRGFVIICE